MKTNRAAGSAGFFGPAILAAGSISLLGADLSDLERRMKVLEEQNEALRQRVEDQQKTIDELSRERERNGEAPPLNESGDGRKGGFSIGNVHLGAEGGIGFFDTGPKGQFPNSEFRVDEAKIFLEAPIWKQVYFFGELDLYTREREATDETFHLGELYVDFENISGLWDRDNLLSIRAGRIDIPFGEEYLSRDVVDNPLISHSLSDFWGIDEGIAFYGSAGRFDYVLAVQNGGHPALRDYDSDKSVALRLGFRPANWVRVSVSAMRTGDLAVEGDEMSELWFGNGFFRALGDPATTTRFNAEVVQGDAHFHWPKGSLKAAVGYADMEDNDSAADNSRSAVYYYVEPVQNLTGKLYTAARFSQIIADDGYPIVGHGGFGRYFFGPLLTENIWRLSFGLGYRWSENLVLKAEYTREERRLRNIPGHESENFFGTEIGLRF